MSVSQTYVRDVAGILVADAVRMESQLVKRGLCKPDDVLLALEAEVAEYRAVDVLSSVRSRTEPYQGKAEKGGQS